MQNKLSLQKIWCKIGKKRKFVMCKNMLHALDFLVVINQKVKFGTKQDKHCDKKC